MRVSSGQFKQVTYSCWWLYKPDACEFYLVVLFHFTGRSICTCFQKCKVSRRNSGYQVCYCIYKKLCSSIIAGLKKILTPACPSTHTGNLACHLVQALLLIKRYSLKLFPNPISDIFWK